jgi:uncharacterized membrane protein
VEHVEQFFALVCRREHCWAPGGEVLPFCQRCTGLYVGAAVAVVLYAAFRPRPTSLSLWIHGLMLLLMVPFGYHLVPQNGMLRTLTGQLFAAGLVCYLSLLPTSRLSSWQREDKRMSLAYAVGVLGSLAIVQSAVHAGGRVTGAVLAWAGLVGLVALAALAIANLVLLPPAVWRIIRSARVPAAS